MKKTPYICFKPEVLEKNYKTFNSLCQKYLEKYVIAYSVKTNSYSKLIKQLNKLGSNFEVASLKEINLTKKSKKSKIFNSPCKTKEELQIAIDNKFLINIDSFYEIDKLNLLLDGGDFNIGLRVSVNNSKFGLDPNQLDEVIEYSKMKNLNIISLHFHGGTQQSFEKFKENIKKAGEVAKFLVEKHGLKLKYLDIGGGFPDRFQLKNLNKNLEDYFEIIRANIGDLRLNIILEPGRCLVADAFELITKVCVIKKKVNVRYAILDAGINILPKITMSQYKFSKINDSKEDSNKKKKEYILAGPLLFNNDTLGKFIGCLKEGNLIKVENVGAYCYNLGWEISYDKPRIVIKNNYNLFTKKQHIENIQETS